MIWCKAVEHRRIKTMAFVLFLRLQHPYNNYTDAPFLFKNVVQLTSDVSIFEETLKNETVSGNLDPPEGALDAMLQVVKCQVNVARCTPLVYGIGNRNYIDSFLTYSSQLL